MTARLKKYKSIIKKKKKKNDETKLNTVEILISKTLIDSYISHDEFFSVNSVLREYSEIKVKNKKFCGTHYTSLLDISRKKFERNGIETIVNNNAIFWLNEKHIEEGLDHKNLQEITIKYHSNYRKHRYEPVNEPKRNDEIKILETKQQSK